MLDTYKPPYQKPPSFIKAALLSAVGVGAEPFRLIKVGQRIYQGAEILIHGKKQVDYFRFGRGTEEQKRAEMLVHYQEATRERTRDLPMPNGQVLAVTPVDRYIYLSAQRVLDEQARTRDERVRLEEGLENVSDIQLVTDFLNKVLARTQMVRPREEKYSAELPFVLQQIGIHRDIFIGIRMHNTELSLAEQYGKEYRIKKVKDETPRTVAATLAGLGAMAGLAALGSPLAPLAPFVGYAVHRGGHMFRKVTVLTDDGQDFEKGAFIRGDTKSLHNLRGWINRFLEIAAPDWLPVEERNKRGWFGKGVRIRKIEAGVRTDALADAIIATLEPEKLYPLLRNTTFYAMRLQHRNN